MDPWIAITRVGDSIILLPLAFMIALWLLSARAWQLAFYWCAGFSIAMTAVVASKLAFIGWGIGVPALDFTGFSGHATRATAVFPVLLFLIFGAARQRTQAMALIAGTLIAAAISWSRLAIEVHSTSEVVAGFFLGAIVCANFLYLARGQTVHGSRTFLIYPALILLIASPFVRPAPAQEWITRMALHLSGRQHPFERHRLQQLGP